MKVGNKKCIFNLSLKNMKASKMRNIILVFAVALTTILFTAFFTIFMTIIDSTQFSNFRMVGTMAHGEFKRLTYEQYMELKDDPDIKEHGLRRFIGAVVNDNFDKNYAEVSYMSENTAKWSFINIKEGSLPKENTNQASVDDNVLSALGIEKKIGEEFTVEIEVDGKLTEETFTLCGWWEYDSVAPANHILISESKLDEIYTKLDTQCDDGMTGRYSLDVMFKNSRNIEEKHIKILERHGYVNDRNADNGIAIGINWGYLTENENVKPDAEMTVMIVTFLLLIISTGYLVIFNIFRTSVANDIRYYGMLKTIGTTGKQIRSILRFQALLLSGIGIPFGLFFGWFVGSVLTPVVMNEINVYSNGTSLNPVIFIFATLFSLVTVLISCHIPASIASKVSPIEALRYTESTSKAKSRTAGKKVSVFTMAMANLRRNTGKTVLTVVSLALPLVIFTLTFIFSNSFDMEKYLSDISYDFSVSDPSYFNSWDTWKAEKAITEEEIEVIRSIDGVTESYIAYGVSHKNSISAYYPDDIAREMLLDNGNEPEAVERMIAGSDKYEGKTDLAVLVLGVEEEMYKTGFTEYEGDLSKLSEEGYIAVHETDHFKLGDNVILEYIDSTEYINTKTGAVYSDSESITMEEWENIDINIESHCCEYEIAVIVKEDKVPGYNYSYLSDFFYLHEDAFRKEAPSCAPLYVVFNTTDEAEAKAEEFLSAYSERMGLDYSSKAKTAEEFESFRRMFVVLGCALSLIIGLVGVLNFVNTILTGIFARRLELAMLEAIGMTGKQLKTMLISEGLIYTGGALITAILLDVLTIPMSGALENIFWFCSYKFTLTPILIVIPFFILLGIILPLATYRATIKKTVVERLREAQ